MPGWSGVSLLSDVASSDSAEYMAALRCPLIYLHSEIPTDLGRLRTLKPEAIVKEIPGVVTTRC
jgi:hypothetical protein